MNKPKQNQNVRPPQQNFHTKLSLFILPCQTENGHHTDNNARPRVSEWEVIQESGMKLKAVFGSGYTGIKNLGNSCYISTVMQVLFSIPDFQRMWVHCDETSLTCFHIIHIYIIAHISQKWVQNHLIALTVFISLLYSTEYCVFDPHYYKRGVD